MDDERIGTLYVRLWLRRLSDLWGFLFPRGLSRSPWLPVIVVAILILGPGLVWQLHMHGRFSTLKRQIRTQLNAGSPSDLDAGRPGGQEAIVLTRKQAAGSDEPEFLSATLLPGMGMTVLQITANLPGRGETPLLAAPTVQELAAGAVEPPNGFMDDHGAIEAPWGGELFGAATPVGTSVVASWKGRSLEESTEGSTQPEAAEGGTLLTEASDTQKQETTPDGMKAIATFRNINTDGRWPSKTDVSVSAQLKAQTIDLVVTAKNTGDHEEPMGIGWHPRFAIDASGRDHIELQLPHGEVMEVADISSGRPSGMFSAASADLARFEGQPAEIGSGDLNAAMVHLRAMELESGPSVVLRDLAAGYGIRMTAISPSIRELRVVSPARGGYLSLGMQSNLDDPFGKEWSEVSGGGIATLQPGESMEWRVRLEIFRVKQ